MPKPTLSARRAARSSSAAPAPARFSIDAAAAAATGRRAVTFGPGRPLLLGPNHRKFVDQVVSILKGGVL